MTTYNEPMEKFPTYYFKWVTPVRDDLNVTGMTLIAINEINYYLERGMKITEENLEKILRDCGFRYTKWISYYDIRYGERKVERILDVEVI